MNKKGLVTLMMIYIHVSEKGPTAQTKTIVINKDEDYGILSMCNDHSYYKTIVTTLLLH